MYEDPTQGQIAAKTTLHKIPELARQIVIRLSVSLWRIIPIVKEQYPWGCQDSMISASSGSYRSIGSRTWKSFTGKDTLTPPLTLRGISTSGAD